MPASKCSQLVVGEFESFEQCNEYLLEHEEVDIYGYIVVSSNVDIQIEIKTGLHSGKRMSKWIHEFAEFLVEISDAHHRAFAIDIAMVRRIGFEIDRCRSLCPQWLRTDDSIQRERRFLKKYKLKANIDYYLKYTEQAAVGYFLTKEAIYKMIQIKYGNQFLNQVFIRTGEILYYFDKYRARLSENQRHIIESLESRSSIAASPPVSPPASAPASNVPILEPESRSYYSPQSSPSSMSSPQGYPEELYGIHRLIENNVKVDGRLSDITGTLMQINHKIDDLVTTIVPDGSRSSMYTTHSSNPVGEHISKVFREYTYIGTEAQL